MDNRFPNLLALSSLPGHPAVAKRLRAQVDEVCRRTGARCLYNAVPKRLHFYRTDPAVGIPIAGSEDDAGIPDRLVRVHNDGACQIDVDRLVEIIVSHFRAAALSSGELAAAKKSAEASAQSDEMAAHQRECQDRRPEALSRLKYKGDHFNMGRHFKRVHTVDGFKERSSGLLVPQGG